jgi:ABC-type glycerol-3-phosphate transport system substrate-binding protein
MCKRSVLFLFLIAALVLGACGPDTPSEPVAGESTLEAGATTTADHVTITFGAISFMRQVYEPLIQAFNAEHPGITVQFVSLDEAYQNSSDYSTQTRQIVSMADTAEAEASEELFKLGLLYDLKPLMNADPSFNADDFYANALNSATAGNGAIYKLPQMLEIPLLLYNSDLWTAHGLAAPKPGWTWRDVEAAAQQIAQKQGNTVTLYGLADDDIYLAVLLDELKQAGLDLAATPPANAQVDRPEVVAALERMGDLFQSGAFFFPPTGADFRDAVAQLIIDQKVAMWGSRAGGDIANIQKRTGGPTPSFALGVAPYPPLPGGTRDFSRGYVISSGTQHPQEAWAWLSFLSKQSIASQASKGGPSDSANVLPARKSLAEQSGYWSRLNDQTKAAVRAALDQPAPPASAPDVLSAYQPLLQALQDIVGGKPAAQAASEAQAAIVALVAEAQLTPTAAPNLAPVVVATPAPNVAPPGATTVTFGMPLAKTGQRLDRLIQQFNQANPTIFVQIKDLMNANGFMSVPDAATQTDCFAMPIPPAASELTATLDLQPLIDSDSTFTLDDYPSALLRSYRQGAELRGLPWGVDFRALIYNKDAFDAAGLAPPSENWTVDDFLNAAQKLTTGQNDNKQYGFVIPRSTSEAVKFLVHLFGTATVRGSGETLAPNFTDPQVVQAARKVVDLLKNDTPHARLNDNPALGRQTDYGVLTGQGRAGMWFAWGMYAYGPQPQFTMAMAPPPLGQAMLDLDDVSTSSMYISARTDKQQACWDWLKFFSTNTIVGASNFPARRSVAQSEAFNQATPGMASTYTAYIAALDRTGQLAPGGESPETPPIDYYWFYRAIDRALQGQNLEQELAQAQALTEQYVACVRSGGQRQSCDQQVDPNYGQE